MHRFHDVRARALALGLSILILTGLRPVSAAAPLVFSTPQVKASFLFGGGPKDAFASVRLGASEQWNQDYWYSALRKAAGAGFRMLSREYGHEEASELQILIKDRKMLTRDSARFAETLESEKANLMELYRLSNRDYNRLAVIAFGILGRETEFGTSLKYYAKERLQLGIWLMKAFEEWSLEPEKNSRGLTQIKTIPPKVRDFYCLKGPKDLRNPRVAAVATLGFLAESLEYMRYRAKSMDLTYVNDSNVYEYALYVYFGSLRQLTNPKFDVYGRQMNEVATPEENLYIVRVKEILKGLVVLESTRAPRPSGQNNACRLRSS